MSREYPDWPRVGVGGVVIRKRESREEVLLVRRGQEPLKGQWSLPGGMLELGETLEQGVCREVAEETGLGVKPVEMLEVLDRIVLDKDGRVRYHYVLVDFLCHATGGELKAGSDTADAQWVSRSELHLQLHKYEPAMLAVVEKGFRQARS